LIRLALAYLLRRPVQLLAVLGVAVGLTALLAVLSVMNGLIAADRAQVRGPLSDLHLVPPPGSGVLRYEDYRQVLEPLPEVRACAPHLVGYAVLGVRNLSGVLLNTPRSADLNGVQVVGIDPEAELQVNDFGRWLRDARRLAVEDPAEPFRMPERWRVRRYAPALVSDRLVEALGLRREEILQLGALPPEIPPPGEDFLPHNGRFHLLGSYAGSDYELDMDRILTLRTGRNGLLENLLAPLDREISDFSEILIRLEEGVDLEQGRRAVLAALAAAGLPAPGDPDHPGGSLETWEERRAPYLLAIENERRVTALVLFFIVVVAAFGLFATLGALVREKVRDLGILAALGCSPWRRGGLLLGVGAAGAAAGTALGGLAGWWLSRHIEAVETFLGWFGVEVFPEGIYVIHHLPSQWIPEQAAALSAATFATGVLFTLAPAIHAATLSPSTALRYE